MTFEEICKLITADCGLEKSLKIYESSLMPFIEIEHAEIHKLCEFLYKNDKTYFDYLACITGLDLGSEKNTFEVVYNLYSIPYEHSFCIKISISKTENLEPAFEVPSVSHIWRTANWHEREIYDLFGILFKNHPDLRRILLPSDWEGFPLRKDYKTDEYYHNLKIDY